MNRFNLITCAKLLAVAAAISLLSGCITNPETGRRQLMLVSESEMTQLGLSSFTQMKKEVPISKDPNANEQIQRVGRRIASVVNLPGAQWEFVVFESKEANAFCLPGGKIGVYTGILPITKTDAGLATVLGHEIGHAVAHHGASRMSEQQASQVVGQVLNSGMSSSDPKVQAVVATAYGVTSKVAVELPY